MAFPHEVLGVPWNADDATVRAAFRRAAKSYHPDLNAGDETAAQRFRQIASARDVMLKSLRLRTRLNRPPLSGPRNPTLDACDDLDEEFARRQLRPSPTITLGGVTCAVLAACVISSALVLVAPTSVSGFAGAITSAVDTERSREPSPATEPDHAALETPTVGRSESGDQPAVARGFVATEPSAAHQAKRGPAAATKKPVQDHLTSEATDPNGVRVAERATAAAGPARKTATRIAPPGPIPPARAVALPLFPPRVAATAASRLAARWARPFSICLTDEGSGRRSPCGGSATN
jgi:hypothetical protein